MIRGLEMSFTVIFWFIFGKISAEKCSFGTFLLHQKISRAHFRRYHHFKGFWQSTASWFRDY